MLDAVIEFAGRLHPMVLHAPIGVAIGLMALEILALLTGKGLAREVRSALAWLMAASAAISAGSGLLLSLESGYDAETVWLHQWLGIGVAAGAILAAVAQQVGWRGLYGVLLVVTCGVLVPAGHFGASMTHGEGFLTAPFERKEKKPVVPGAAPDSGPGNGGELQVRGPADPPVGLGPPSVYASAIAPVFENRCVNCHGATKHKGGLSLHTVADIEAGGDTGPIFVAGDVAGSEIVRRLHLPIDDEEHMPPKSKGQPTTEEIAAIEAWIAGGAKFAGAEAAGTASGAVGTGPTKTAEAGAAGGAPPIPIPAGPAAADLKALEAIRAKLVHVEPVSRGSALLVVDASAVAKDIGDEQLESMLSPVREQVADLMLARTGLTDRGMNLLAVMPNLRRLNISATGVGDAGLAALAGHQKLEELVLSQTKITGSSADLIAGLPALRRVFVWKAGLTPEVLASLRGKRPDVEIDAGDAPVAAVAEVEPELKLTGDAPVPGAAVVTPVVVAADLLKPVNAVCPVSGKAVDTNFAIVHKGRVIGFCCKVCLGQFLDDPAKFEGKVEAKAP